jgi:hypothetical protein
MLARLSWDQFLEWAAFAEIEPFGEERADWRAGMVASVIANVNRDPKKGKPFGPRDFMPDFSSSKKAATGSREPLMSGKAWGEAKSMARIYAAAAGVN